MTRTPSPFSYPEQRLTDELALGPEWARVVTGKVRRRESLLRQIGQLCLDVGKSPTPNLNERAAELADALAAIRRLVESEQ